MSAYRFWYAVTKKVVYYAENNIAPKKMRYGV